MPETKQPVDDAVVLPIAPEVVSMIALAESDDEDVLDRAGQKHVKLLQHQGSHKKEQSKNWSPPVELPQAPETVSKIPFAFPRCRPVVKLPGHPVLAEVDDLDTSAFSARFTPTSSQQTSSAELQDLVNQHNVVPIATPENASGVAPSGPAQVETVADPEGYGLVEGCFQSLMRSPEHGAKKGAASRPAGKWYAKAARERRQRQEQANHQHHPSKDEAWICGFCEYESIFGKPPEALIRQYEIKDRKQRRRRGKKPGERGDGRTGGGNGKGKSTRGAQQHDHCAHCHAQM